MPCRIAQWTLDVQNVDVMAAFWSATLGYRIDPGTHGSAKLYPPTDAGPDALVVWLQRSDTPKAGKNRGHPDLTVTAADVGVEVQRLIALGARRVDVGQSGTEDFDVMADPEDNEFCVLHVSPYPDGARR